MTSLLIGLLIAILFSAFFSGMEIAFVSSNRMLAEMDREKHGLSQKAMDVFYSHPSNFVSTMLVGNNIALVIYGILFAQIFDQTLFASLNDSMRVLCDTLLSTLVVLFTGEFLPKTFFKSNPNTMLTLFALPAWSCYVLLWPVSRFATLLSKGILRLFGVHMDKNSGEREFTKVDLDYLVQSSIDNARSKDEELRTKSEEVRTKNEDQGSVRDSRMEVMLFQNALDFSETKVRDCMVPRTEIDAVEDTATIEQLTQTFIESGHSKILVYHEDIDHIIGYIHSSDLFSIEHGTWKSAIEREQSQACYRRDARTLNSQFLILNSQLLREVDFVPETMLASKLMKILMAKKRSLAVVVDEFGGTAGLVSLEDIMEEITGEIEDEHDTSNLVAKQLGEHEYMLSARQEIEKVNELFDLDLPESDDYMTIGGLILHAYQSFPKLNEVVHIGKFEFKIVKNTATKIELVRLKVND